MELQNVISTRESNASNASAVFSTSHTAPVDLRPASPLAKRGLKPLSQLAASRSHGDRLRYIAGCRCNLCRKANSTYEQQRQQARKNGDWNGLVPADRARAHLLKLSAAGVGRRAVAAASDIHDSTLGYIRNGVKTQIRALNERRILAVTVDMASDHALTSSLPSWTKIKELMAAGFTKSRISKEMGYNSSLQIGRQRITVRNAGRIAKVHQRLMSSDEILVNSGPTLQRLQALRDEGYHDKQIARHLSALGVELPIPKKRVQRGLENKVLSLYQELTL